MREAAWLVGLGLLLASSAATAQEVKRVGSPQSPIAGSVELPPGSRIVYVSGQVPDPVAPPAEGEAADYGDTVTQTRSVLAKIQRQLAQHGMDMGDVVMMRVFLVRPPGSQGMDFAGMMTGYREFFGTEMQPGKPARSTIEVPALVLPGFLVEIEATAARAPGQ